MRTFDERFMADWIDCDGLFQQPMEELSSAAGCPSVKSEHEFIKIMIQIPMRYTALMDPKQPPLEQGCDPVNAGKVHERGRTPPAIQDRGIMLVAQALQTSIPLSPICDDHAAPSDVRAHESSENPAAGIGDPLKSYSADLLAAFFRCDTDENLVPSSAELGLIDFNPAVELLTPGPNHSTAQFMEHGPSSFVASQTQGSLKSERADSALLIGDPPSRPKPEAQADLASFKDCADRDPNVLMAASAAQQASRGLPNLSMTAPRALDAIRPAEAEQIFAASLFRSESVFEFEQSRGIPLGDMGLLGFSGASWIRLPG